MLCGIPGLFLVGAAFGLGYFGRKGLKIPNNLKDLILAKRRGPKEA